MKDLCSFSLLAQRKRTKRKGLFGPHKCHFCLWQNLIYKPNFLQGFKNFVACKCYANEVAYTFLHLSEYYIL
ncbi:MAG: hypothetical protein CFE24_08530 [Flavobacterium sp. BFFFF2]|nr:MAG: hypothetical protein CFE24_08530 [Flavobacterium sp. BFFFF2]